MPTQEMLINYVPGEECRIAIVEDGRLEELYTERTSADLHVGNIYRGRVTNVEPSIQAAFVDFGLERAGFLHITDLHPRYFPGQKQEETERVGHKTPRRERPPMQHALRRGQEIIVQVLKEGIGTKGPTLTSYLSIPGRFLVMMPAMERHGVSRKIEDMDKRRDVRKILDELDPPENFGFIVRTAGFDRTKTELKRDLNYLLRLWKDIETRKKIGKGPTDLYIESDLIIRTLRDVMTSDVKRIVVDDYTAAVRAKQFLRIAMPRSTTSVIYHKGPMPLFDSFGIEQQIQQINDRQVPLKCGGSLVFDSTEALVAIDVNSGKFRDAKDSEESAYRTNLEAVDEIARQLRLRDLGGLLVLDLIDMYVHRHRREVERRFKEAMKKDRARTKMLKISELGMLEMTRQRMRPSLKKSIYNECPTCGGSGQVLSAESVVLQVMRRLAVAISADRVGRAELLAHPEVVTELSNRKRDALVRLEQASGKAIRVKIDPAAGPDAVRLVCYDASGNQIDLDKLPSPRMPRFTEADEISVEDVKRYAAENSGGAPIEDDIDDMDLDDEGDEPMTRPAGKSEPIEPAAASSGEAAGIEGGGKKKRRRRRRRRGRGGDASEGGAAEVTTESVVEHDDEADHADEPDGAAEMDAGEESHEEAGEGAAAGPVEVEYDENGEPIKKRRRRRRGGRRHRKRREQAAAAAAAASGAAPKADAPDVMSNGYEGDDVPMPEEDEPQPMHHSADADAHDASDGNGQDAAGQPKKKRRRRRRRGRGGNGGEAPAGSSDGGSSDAPQDTGEPTS
ncbi:MAG: Rne/Rng family ribonuclease [Planctomycetes bacterium]|nr:Rne/Rng family ribonuclease [Planctomycetota bacterium]